MLAALTLVLSGCAVPTAPGDAPDILTLTPAVPEALPFQQVNPFIVSCPTPAAQRDPSIRQRVPGSTATIATPAGVAVAVAPIGGGSGGVFSVDGRGLIAVAYDQWFATDLRNLFGPRRVPAPKVYSNWCTTTVAGREAFVHFDLGFDSDADGEVTPFFGNDMAVLLTEPSGRRMNIRLIGPQPQAFLGTTPVSLLPLLDIVGSLQW